MRWILHARVLVLLLGAAACGAGEANPVAPPTPPSPKELRPAASFASILDADERARALFLEASLVMLSPRCTNCHPADDSPRQREGEAHDPPVVRGPDDRGPPGMGCATCHQDTNLAHARVPGAPNWHLAPKVMAWIGKTPAALCAQVKDPARNGGKSLTQIVEHATHDPLVAWGFSPGADRAPAPGTQARFGELVDAWASAGAACPREGDVRR